MFAKRLPLLSCLSVSLFAAAVLHHMNAHYTYFRYFYAKKGNQTGGGGGFVCCVCVSVPLLLFILM